MKKVFLFGGGFDPVHLGHLSLIQSILSLGGKVHVVPAGPHPYGKAYFFSPRQRLLLLKAALGCLDLEDIKFLPLEKPIRDELLNTRKIVPNLHVCTYEIHQTKVCYTIDLIEYFLRENPEAQLNVVIGADQAEQIHRWKDLPKLAALVRFWTVPRAGNEPSEDIPWNYIPFTPIEVSSTEVRRLMEAGDEKWQTLLPPLAARLAVFFLKNPLS